MDDNLLTRAAMIKKIAELDVVAGWAQAVLTALNSGDVQSESLLHKKLRQIMIEYRETLS